MSTFVNYRYGYADIVGSGNGGMARACERHVEALAVCQWYAGSTIKSLPKQIFFVFDNGSFHATLPRLVTKQRQRV